MIKSSILKNNLFAYYIGMNQGAVTFGGIDKKYIASKDDDKFRFAVVTEKTYWTIEIVRVLLQYGEEAPKDTNLCSTSPDGQRCKAIVDTGTYLIYGPQEQMQVRYVVAIVCCCLLLFAVVCSCYFFYSGKPDQNLRFHSTPSFNSVVQLLSFRFFPFFPFFSSSLSLSLFCCCWNRGAHR